MKKNTLLILFIILFSNSTYAQDEIILKSTGKGLDYEIKILEVKNDTISFKAFRKIRKLPLSEVSTYHIHNKDANMIDTVTTNNEEWESKRKMIPPKVQLTFPFYLEIAYGIGKLDWKFIAPDGVSLDVSGPTGHYVKTLYGKEIQFKNSGSNNYYSISFLQSLKSAIGKVGGGYIHNTLTIDSLIESSQGYYKLSYYSSKSSVMNMFFIDYETSPLSDPSEKINLTAKLMVGAHIPDISKNHLFKKKFWGGAGINMSYKLIKKLDFCINPNICFIHFIDPVSPSLFVKETYDFLNILYTYNINFGLRLMLAEDWY
jgi:hypothetical protein